MLPIALATEDELSEAIGLRLIADCPVPFEEPLLLRNNGFGYLKSSMSKWQNLAHRHPVLLLTDLDQKACVIEMKRQWLSGHDCHPQLLFRIAVREIESWVLADHEGFRSFIGKKGRLPSDPDDLSDPKQHLLGLIKKYASRVIRDDMVREEAGRLRQGLGYNRRLANWAQLTWNMSRAASRSPSLKRACEALARCGEQMGK